MQLSTTSSEFHTKTRFSEDLLVWSPYSHRDKFQRKKSIDLSASITKDHFGLSSAVIAKRMQNGLAPISTLSIELLSHVFVLTDYQLPEELSTITQVCHSWRIVAINTANLWTCIPCNDLFHMEGHLRRSKNLALDVNLLHTQEEEQPADIESAVYVLLHLHRIERLTVELVADDAPGYFKTFDALCHKPAPRLRYLELTANDGVAWGTAESTTALIFPNAQLNHLKLYQVAIFPNSHLLSEKLTHLHIQNLPDLLINPQEFRDVLRRTPCLEHLHLEDVLSALPYLPESGELEPVYLASLKVLTVRAQSSMCIADFFMLTTFPGPLNALRIRAAENEHDELEAMVQVIMDACADWGAFWSSDIHSLKVEGDVIDDVTYLCFRGFTKDRVERLSMELPHQDTRAIAQIHSMLYISGSHSIRMVSWDFTVDEVMMRDAFRLCPNLEKIELSGHVIPELCCCLADPELREFTQHIGEIVIVDEWSQAKEHEEAEELFRQSQIVALDKLIDVFAMRRDSGQRIQSFTLDKWMVSSSSNTYDKLHDVVGIVKIVDES